MNNQLYTIIVVDLVMAYVNTYEFVSMAPHVVYINTRASIWDLRLINFIALLATSVEDDGITSDRVLLRTGSVNTISALVSLKYSIVPF